MNEVLAVLLFSVGVIVGLLVGIFSEKRPKDTGIFSETGTNAYQAPIVEDVAEHSPPDEETRLALKRLEETISRATRSVLKDVK